MSSLGKISNRPTSMSKIRTSLLQLEKTEKFPVGPTSERPGPTLLMAVVTAVKFVTASRFSKLSNTTDAAKIKKYAAAYTLTARTTPCGTGL